MTEGLTRRQQWDALVVLAHANKLQAGFSGGYHEPYFIGAKRYPDITSATCALLHAFDKVGIRIPDSIKQRPIDL